MVFLPSVVRVLSRALKPLVVSVSVFELPPVARIRPAPILAVKAFNCFL